MMYMLRNMKHSPFAPVQLTLNGKNYNSISVL